MCHCPKSLRSSLIMLTSSLCIILPLSFIGSSASTWESICWWHICNRDRPFPRISTSVFGLFSVRGFLAECIFHSLPPAPQTEKPLMYAQRIKLKAHNYTSQQSEDSDPVRAEDKHENQTMQEATAHL